MIRNLCSKRLWLELAIVVGFLSVMGSPARIHAQVAGATLTGTVKDSSGAIIPNAQVTITDVATGVTRSSRQPASTSCAAFGASVVGLHDT